MFLWEVFLYEIEELFGDVCFNIGTVRRVEPRDLAFSISFRVILFVVGVGEFCFVSTLL